MSKGAYLFFDPNSEQHARETADRLKVEPMATFMPEPETINVEDQVEVQARHLGSLADEDNLELPQL